MASYIAKQLLSTSKVQFLGGNNIADGFVRSISHPLSKVNTKIKNIFETLRFKDWFMLLVKQVLFQ